MTVYNIMINIVAVVRVFIFIFVFSGVIVNCISIKLGCIFSMTIVGEVI